MTDVAKAIQALNEDNDNSHEFVITGEPSNETEYQRDVKYVSGADDNGSAIFSDTQPYTWSEVNTKKSALQTQYNNDQYKRDRAASYPEIGEQLDKLFHDIDNGTLTTSGDFYTALNAVKTANPKPSE
jgi:hypothetical protein